MTRHLTRSIAIAAALGVATLPLAAYADEVKVATSAQQYTKLQACTEAMNRANDLYGSNGKKTGRSIGSCECESVDIGMGETRWTCAVRVNFRDQ